MKVIKNPRGKECEYLFKVYTVKMKEITRKTIGSSRTWWEYELGRFLCEIHGRDLFDKFCLDNFFSSKKPYSLAFTLPWYLPGKAMIVLPNPRRKKPSLIYFEIDLGPRPENEDAEVF